MSEEKKVNNEVSSEEELGGEDRANNLTDIDEQSGESNQNSEVQNLQDEILDLKDKLARTVAEVENTRKRFQQQLAENSRYAIKDFASNLVDVFEDFYRLIDNAPAEDYADDNNLSAFISGVNLTHKNLDKTLKQLGVERIYPLNQKFDHNLHQAISQIHDESEAGTVVQVISAGYTLNGRILKEALVSISKGSENL